MLLASGGVTAITGAAAGNRPALHQPVPSWSKCVNLPTRNPRHRRNCRFLTQYYNQQESLLRHVIIGAQAWSCLFTCIICKSDELPSLVEAEVKGDTQKKLRVVQCPNCGHIQLDPPAYSLNHYQQDKQVGFVIHDYGTPIEKLVEHSRIEARRRHERLANRGVNLDAREIAMNSPIRVLDIGGGYGFFGSELLRRNPEFAVDVLEPSETRVQAGKDFILQGEFSSMPNFMVSQLDEEFESAHRAKYNLVTMWHVLEHVPDPIRFLQMAFSLLAPHGSLCIEVPNSNDELKNLSPAFRKRTFMIEHLSYFTPSTLESVISRALPNAKCQISGYQRYGIFNYFHWIHFDKPQGASPDLLEGADRWWLEASWRSAREQMLTSDALYAVVTKAY
jgi:2-polyprenyl-3-methyl-5-hydroxy-6-metoxy-1,4-benzoquinol methylase